jgi:hypothetical protein
MLRQQAQEVIRAWAKDTGIDIADRGRLPDHIVKRYRDAHT